MDKRIVELAKKENLTYILHCTDSSNELKFSELNKWNLNRHECVYEDCKKLVDKYCFEDETETMKQCLYDVFFTNVFMDYNDSIDDTVIFAIGYYFDNCSRIVDESGIKQVECIKEIAELEDERIELRVKQIIKKAA